MFHPQEYTDDIDIEHLTKRLERIIGDRLDLTFNAGIVVEHIDGAELVGSGADIVGHLIFQRDIGGDGQWLGGCRQIPDGGFKVGFPAVDGDDARTAFGQQPDRCGSNDAGSAGDNGDFAVQANAIGHLVSPLLLLTSRRLCWRVARNVSRGWTIPFVVGAGKGSETALSPPYSAC